MKVKILLITFLISVFTANAQISNLHLVNTENMYSRIEQARIDSKNSIIEVKTGSGIYYFDLKSGRLLTKFGGTDWADFGTSMICDSLLKINPLKYSNDSLIAIDSLGQLFKHKIGLNFTPINRGILPKHKTWYYRENDQEPNEIEIRNNECGYNGTYIVCEDDDPLHKLIKNFWIKINNTVEISENSNSTNRFAISIEDKCSFIIKSDSALILDYEIFENKEVFENDFNVNSHEIILKSQANYSDEFVVYSMRQSIKTNNLLQYSSENNKYFFDESFFLISPDSTRLLYRPYDFRSYQPLVLFDLIGNRIVSVINGEACMCMGFKSNETDFSEDVISFSGDSKFVLIGNRLFNTHNGSEVFEYYKWLRMNDKDLGRQPWDDESEFEYINLGANFSFFSDSTNICVVSGEKLNYFNLNNMTGTNWQIPKEYYYHSQDSLSLKLNNIDISKFLG